MRTEGYNIAITRIAKNATLDIMHAAVGTLTSEQVRTYRFHLRNLCGTYEDAIDATAAQRAEAFLRTLNLWTDNQPI